ncbi:MAG TPA: DUF1616 domain-containing protein [Thermoplasmata archaeon]|nr:DUF1616 domain-containing protein [Thermoplasmata archaeon]
MSVLWPFAVLGGLLVFVLPGYALTRALFPEWRVRGEGGWVRGVEIASLSLIGSVSMTVLVGFGLLNVSPSGFQASWSEPTLEIVLAAVTVAGLVVAAARGAFSKVPPGGPDSEPDPGFGGGWEVIRQLDRLAREERSLRRSLRTAPPGSEEEMRLRREIEVVRSSAESVRAARERELAG